ncbi:MAG: hypothetical protein ABSD58_00595 [Verrucomicrobiia bacterium]|jgi:hypothetical protein
MKAELTAEAIHVNSIARSRFDRLFAGNCFLEPVIGNEMEWFVDGSENLLGTIADGLLFDRWIYVLLARGGITGFRILRMEFGVSTRDEATVRLLRIMKACATPTAIASPV